MMMHKLTKTLAMLALVTGAVSASAAEDYNIDIPVLAHNVKIGDTITADDLHDKSIDMRRLSNNTVRMPDEAIGMEATRNMMAGSVIYRNYLRVPPTVRRNQPVIMRYDGGGIELVGTGKAMHDAMLGERVKVMNERSHQIIVGTVSGENEVEMNEF